MQNDTVNRGWTSSSTEIKEIQVLDAVYEANSEDGGTLAPGIVAHVCDLDWGLAADVANALRADGLVHAHDRLGGGVPSLSISDTGRGAVRVRQERRSNKVLRSVACREALLDWVYLSSGFADLVDFAGDVRAHLEGDPFTEVEVASAAEDLREKGLVETVDTAEVGPIRIRIATPGKTVVEDFGASIRAYENRGAARAGDTYTFTGNHVSGMIVAGVGNQATQASQSGGTELVDLIKAVVEAARGTDVEDRISKLMAQLELEVDEEEPDEGIVGKVLERAESVATNAGANAVVQLVGRVAQYINDHGIAQLTGLG